LKLKIHKKLSTASLNSEFTWFKKKVLFQFSFWGGRIFFYMATISWVGLLRDF